MSKKTYNETEATEKNTAAENSTPAAVETVSVTEAVPESKEEAAKTDAPKKRGRKPAASKTNTPAAKKEKNVPAKNKKSAAAKNETVSEIKTETPKAETPKKRGRKSAAEKTETTAAKKKSTSASRSKKTAEAKKESTAEVIKAEIPSTDAPKKRGRKSGTATGKASAAAKGGRKKAVTRDAIIDAAKKRMKAADISKIKYLIALNLEITNFDSEDEKYVYILINDGKINVEPYRYNDSDFGFRGDAETILNVMNGKINIYDAFANGLIKIDGGNIKKAILFINAAF